jgi:hypothetical protein
VHPYKTFPDRQFWSRAVSGTPWADVFRGQTGKFRLSHTEPVASAGSCFARRIAEFLVADGYNYQLFESCHPLMEAKAAEYGYGTFSCRYGNIYSTRQLRQLFEEALGIRPPILHVGQVKSGAYIDLLRPNINEVGFGSIEEMRVDRLYHLSRVRVMIEQMQTFVFTLGLTEAWADEARDVVYGSHPGVFLESLDASQITPINLDYEEVLRDLEAVLDILARHNQHGGPRVILTVSPVALAATHQDSHVLAATSYSKSVLRAAAGKLAASRAEVDYFPSYEIFALSQSFGQFLAEDLRDVSRRGVEVAMRVFRDMFLEPDAQPAATQAPAPVAIPAPPPEPAGRSLAEAECDEIANAVFGARG